MELNEYYEFSAYVFTTVCPESGNPFYIVTYYMKWFTTFWTYSTLLQCLEFGRIIQTNTLTQGRGFGGFGRIRIRISNRGRFYIEILF